MRRSSSSAPSPTDTLFTLGARNQGGPEEVTLKAHCGPDDDGGPCITVMLLTED